MSRNAVAAMAVVLVSGFAGCAATARASEPVVVRIGAPVPAISTAVPMLRPAPLSLQPQARAFSAAGSG